MFIFCCKDLKCLYKITSFHRMGSVRANNNISQHIARKRFYLIFCFTNSHLITSLCCVAILYLLLVSSSSFISIALSRSLVFSFFFMSFKVQQKKHLWYQNVHEHRNFYLFFLSLSLSLSLSPSYSIVCLLVVVTNNFIPSIC